MNQTVRTDRQKLFTVNTAYINDTTVKFGTNFVESGQASNKEISTLKTKNDQ